MKPLAPLALALTLAATAAAQTATPFTDPANLRGERPRPRTGLELPQDQEAAGLAQMLLKLRTRASLMMIVAHPDDEDGGMLTYESRGHGVRAAMLTLTRGEGGQNLMTGDFNDALGLIRTQELLAADRYFGIDQMFGTEVDFGFSKTREEALAQWTHDRCLYDAVRAVRLFRPLVVTSVFTGNPTDGHGHHQVSGQMAQEVFAAAADPTVFPEMLKEGIEPWAPLKVYARVPFAQATKEGVYDYATGKYVPVRFYNYVTKSWSNTIPKADVVIHEGEYSDALGMSYVQFARLGLALQKTQVGAGMRVPPSGAVEVGYTRYGSRVQGLPNSGPQTKEEKSFFDGIDISLSAIAAFATTGAPELFRTGLDKAAASIEEASTHFKPSAPAAIAPQLAQALKQIDALLAVLPETQFSIPTGKASVQHELRVKRAQLNSALATALGIAVDGTATVTAEGELPVSQPVRVTVSVKKESSEVVSMSHRAVFNAENRSAENRLTRSLDVPQSKAIADEIIVPAAYTGVLQKPYFDRPGIKQPFYDLYTRGLRNAPQSPASLTAVVSFNYLGVVFEVARIVHAGLEAVAVVPPLSVSLAPAIAVVPAKESPSPLNFQINVKTSVPNMLPRVEMDMPDSWVVKSPEDDFTLKAPGDAHTVTGKFVPIRITEPKLVTAFVMNSMTKDRVGTNLGYRRVGYLGLPLTNYFQKATALVVPMEVSIAPGLRVAYLSGTGDEVQSLLENIGVHATTVSVTDIAASKLEAFDVLVVGVRAYTAHPDLLVANSHLLSFAKNGGTVIVQYQSHAFDHPELAPFPLHLGGDGEKVVEELSKVQLSPTPSGVLAYPNKLTPADFDGWVSERGHGFPASWDAAYETPTECHDVDQDAQRGGLLVARYGKGYYVYTAFALYRQLPEAVPGAYRLFANMLSIGRQTPAK